MAVSRKKRTRNGARASKTRPIDGIALLGMLILSAISIWTSTKLLPPVSTHLNETDCPSLRSVASKETPFEPVKDYVPSYSEKYVLDHAKDLGYKKKGKRQQRYHRGCEIWREKDSDPELYKKLKEYALELENHTQAIQNFEPVPNVLEAIQETGTHDICKRLRLHPEGVKGLFPSGQLSLSRAGFIEPMLPPFRSHKICDDLMAHILDLQYLVHDFETMCLQLKPRSKVILLDLGASLAFHRNDSIPGDGNPMLEVMELYEKFGFYFDHIYAFEVTPLEPTEVFEKLLPEKYLSKYHWINTGVTTGASDKMNPLHSILTQFKEDDLILVKLDIDTPSLEGPLVQQIVEGGDNGIYHRLIDQFYFEHHIFLKELRTIWGLQVNGTISDSLDMFTTLRKKGIASHSWP